MSLTEQAPRWLSLTIETACWQWRTCWLWAKTQYRLAICDLGFPGLVTP